MSISFNDPALVGWVPCTCILLIQLWYNQIQALVWSFGSAIDKTSMGIFFKTSNHSSNTEEIKSDYPHCALSIISHIVMGTFRHESFVFCQKSPESLTKMFTRPECPSMHRVQYAQVCILYPDIVCILLWWYWEHISRDQSWFLLYHMNTLYCWKVSISVLSLGVSWLSIKAQSYILLQWAQ